MNDKEHIREAKLLNAVAQRIFVDKNKPEIETAERIIALVRQADSEAK